MKKLCLGSLFSGAGLMDAGFLRTGCYELAWMVEKDRNAQRVLAHHHPDVPLFDDVQTVGRHNLEPVDVIAGGFPCQDLSIAGKREGLAGIKSGLFYEMTRIVHELQPRFLVWENVPGLLSSDRGRDFARALMELGRIGFHGSWTVLDAQWFGVPQRRRRVFGVFARRDIVPECTAEILALQPRSERYPASGGEQGAKDAAGIGGGASGDGRRGAVMPGDGPVGTITGKWAKATGGPAGGECQNIIAHALPAHHSTAQKSKNHAYPTEVSGCMQHKGLSASGNEAGTLIVGHPGLVSPAVASPLTAGAHAEGVSAPGRRKEDDMNLVIQPEVIGPLLGSGERGYRVGAEEAASGHVLAQPVLSFQERGRDGGPCLEMQPDLAYALTAPDGGSRGQEKNIQTGMIVRRITPIEACRLMGAPDDFLDLDPPLSDSAKYKLLGNGVVVQVAEWIALRLAKAHRGEKIDGKA